MRFRPLLCGLALLIALWTLPIGSWLGHFPAHMIRHMGLVAIAAPLLVLGLGNLAGTAPVPPVPAAACEFVVVWAWHLPALHAFGRGSNFGFAFEQASFLAVGLAVWAACLRARNPLAGAAGLLLTSMHMTLLGALLVLAPRDLYAMATGAAPDLPAQQLGGMLMLAIGTPIYLLGGLALTARALEKETA